jgi:hypothetical protein
MSPIEALLKATEFVDQNLAALCAEMVSFKELGIHEGGLIGEAAKIITSCSEIQNSNARSIVESAIALAAMRKCAATAKTIRADPPIEATPSSWTGNRGSYFASPYDESSRY